MNKMINFKIIFSCSILFFTFILTSCGFQPRSDQSLPEKFRVLYLKSDNPYGQFERNLTKALTDVGVTVLSAPAPNVPTLQILQTSLTSVPSSVGTGPQSTIFTVTFTANIAIYDSDGTVLFAPSNVNSTSTMIVNAQQAVSATNQIDILNQELQHDVITQIFAILTAPKLNVVPVHHQSTRHHQRQRHHHS